MRKIVAAGLGTLLLLTMMGGSALAQYPEHPHMLVLHPEYDVIEFLGEPWIAAVGFHRCVDLAANQSLGLNAHHDSVHTGTAGEALFSAGHAVAPGAPLTPFANCAELEAALPIPLEPKT